MARNYIDLGDIIGFEGRDWCVVRLIGTNRVVLEPVEGGDILTVPLAEVFQNREVSLSTIDGNLSRVKAACGPAMGDVEILIRHLQEVIDGSPLQGPDTPKRSQYDPTTTTLRERLEEKSRELSGAGWTGMSVPSLKRKVSRYKKHGAAGLMDGRSLRANGPELAQTDERLVAIIESEMRKKTDDSNVPMTVLINRIRHEASRQHPDEPGLVPSDRQLRRLIDVLDARFKLKKTAKLRETMKSAPKRPFNRQRVLRPGERTEIDSTPLDVMVYDPKGEPYRPILTILLDVATQAIIAFTLRPRSAKAIDHALMVARIAVPQCLRPGQEHLALLHSTVLPAKALVRELPALAKGYAQPYIIPESITTDRGADYLAANFVDAMRLLGVDIHQAPPGTPTGKSHVERKFRTIRQSFVAYLASHTGGSVDHRGRNVQALWDLHELDALFHSWVVSVYLNTKTASLADPFDPTKNYTPNEMYAATYEYTGIIPVPYGPDTYISLMPWKLRTIQRSGININNRTYDSPELQPWRLKRGPDHGQWRIHYDPYNPTTVWVQNPQDQHYISCVNNELAFARTPFVRETFADLCDAGWDSEDARREAEIRFLDMVDAHETSRRQEIVRRQRELEGQPTPRVEALMAVELYDDDDDISDADHSTPSSPSRTRFPLRGAEKEGA